MQIIGALLSYYTNCAWRAIKLCALVVTGDTDGKRIEVNGKLAAEMFCEVERLTPKIPAFTWLFIRPPWTVGGACCKEVVFENMIANAKKVGIFRSFRDF